MASVATVVSVGKGDSPGVGSREPMKTKNTEDAEEGRFDFDLEKLFRGEIGPNVAEEIAAK